MRISTFAAALAFTAGALAQRWRGPGPNGAAGYHCLNETGVATLVNGYTYLLEKPGGPSFNSTANAILSDKFFVDSDSILTLSQRPLGGLAYPSKQAYIASQSQTPPLPVVKTLATFHSCDKISWRWNASGIGNDEYEVKGIIEFDVNPTTVQIDAVYSEFNTAAFEAVLGYPECQQG
ncbi:hypothetical protein VM1G_06552 [Cytospora mali]|uniref:NTF2-like domain-containing protein n=1 Tax=Cytospora mali TaxID=578113 RepID=A0A194W0T7_CYTMA|nr:hypothetical protein VM1G_06552 [Valsa mali]